MPGIPGVGPKTAAKWLTQFGSLQAIFDSADEIPGKVGESLRENMQLAVRNRRLNHLVRDLDFDFTFDQLEIKGVDSDEVTRVFKKLHFRSLTERVLRLKGSGAKSDSRKAKSVEAEAEAIDVTEDANVFEELNVPEARNVTGAELSKWLKTEKALVAIGTRWIETDCVAVGFATETERLEWAPKSNQDVVDTVGEWLTSSSPKAVFDEKNTSRKLLGLGLQLDGVEYDVLLMTFLHNPVRRGYSLDEIALEYLGLEVARKATQTLLDTGGDDASLDAWLSANLAPRLFEKLRLSDSLRALNEIELPTSKTLARMEHTGIAIDREKLSLIHI